MSADACRDMRVDVRLKRSIESGDIPKQLLVEGPAGTGKTFAILCLLHLLAADYPDLRILICRQTRVSLTESVLVTFEREVLARDGMEGIASTVSRKGRTAYKYPSGSEIVLGGLDNPDRILSTAWDIIFVNEAIEVNEDAWDALWSRLNRPGRPAWLGYLLADTNPGDPSHWLNKRCDAGEIVRWRTGHKANPLLHDGQDWTAIGKAYIFGTLGRLKGTRRKRLLEGLWAAGEGQWFDTFDSLTHVAVNYPEQADYHPGFNVHLSVDTGVHVGAVWWQIRGDGEDALLTVFGDYYSYNESVFHNAQAILDRGKKLTANRPYQPQQRGYIPAHYDVGRMDPSGNANNGTGIVIGSEFARAGLKLEPWIKHAGCIASRLALIESFMDTDPPRILIHPRCQNVIDSFSNYKRKKRRNQWVDEPEDPQHPYEECMDALGSGLLDRFPEGRKLVPKLARISGRRVF